MLKIEELMKCTTGPFRDALGAAIILEGKAAKAPTLKGMKVPDLSTEAVALFSYAHGVVLGILFCEGGFNGVHLQKCVEICVESKERAEADLRRAAIQGILRESSN